MRNRALILATTLAVMALYGCTSDEMAGRFLAAPGKFMLYTCEELAKAAESNAERQRELEAPIAIYRRCLCAYNAALVDPYYLSAPAIEVTAGPWIFLTSSIVR